MPGRTTRFGLQRKIVAAMTSSGWQHAPHVSVLYEADVTKLLETLREINAGLGLGRMITLNTAMLKIIAEGLKACPIMNGHIHFSDWLARGSVTTIEEINVTMPVMIDRDNMMTLNVRGMEKMSMSEIRDAVKDLIRRARNTHMPQVMYEVAMHDTMQELKHLRIGKAVGRLIGALLDGTWKELLHGEEKRRYKKTPPAERLTWKDLEQGTVTVSNPGMLFKKMNGACLMLEIIPPQIAALAVNMVRDKPVVRKDGSIDTAKIVEMTIVFDHRAMDGNDLVPFLNRVEQLISSPDLLREMI